MEKQNRVNKEKDRNTQRQETEVVTGKEEIGKRAIRKNTRRECHQTMKKILKKKERGKEK